MKRKYAFILISALVPTMLSSCELGGLKNPEFSKESGFYDEAFDLKISGSWGSKIYYTLDGSIPTTESTLYENPLHIEDASDQDNLHSAHTDISPTDQWGGVTAPYDKVDKATVVNAIAVNKKGEISDVMTAVYFVNFQHKADYYGEYKILSLVTDPDNLFNYETGIYVTGKVLDEWKESDDYKPFYDGWQMPANYTETGKDWEKPAHLQIFENGECTLTQDVGIRVHGGASRSSTQKSLNIYAREAYGKKKISYDLFSSACLNESGEAITKFKTFMIRNGGNDAQYCRFRDRLIQSAVADCSFLTQAMEPCIVFIDGEYWGQYDITEKIDASYLQSHCGVDKNSVCMIKNEELEEGSEEQYADWNQLREWIVETDFSSESAYNELCEQIDMQEFADYVATELYIANLDWGTNNMIMWKTYPVESEETENTESTESEENPFTDGKWRFVLYDTEYSTGLYGQATANSDNIKDFLAEDCFLSDLFRSAWNQPKFQDTFYESSEKIATEYFNADTISGTISKWSITYKDLVVDTYNRFWPDWPGGWGASTNYWGETDNFRTFFEERGSYYDVYLKNNLGK